MMTDAELLRQYAEARDQGAFAEVVRRQVNLVYRAALRQLGGDAHRAEEATQLVFTLLARKASAVARHPSLAGWLYTTTHFTVRSLRRDERRRQAREQEAHSMHELAKDETSHAEWERLRPALDEAMQQLGEREREALLARFFEGRPLAEIGALLRVSEDAARMRIDRALEKLRAKLARRGVTSTAAALGVLLANEAAAAVPAGLAATVTGAAMTGVAAGSGSGMGAILFMSMMKTQLGLAALLALVVAMGSAGYAWRQHARAERRLLLAQDEQAAAVTRLREGQRRAEIAEQEAARGQKEREEARRTAASRPAPSAAPATPVANPFEERGRAFLSRHPEVKQALDDYVSANRRFRYASMYRELHLTPEQIKAWEAEGRGGMGATMADGQDMLLPYGGEMGSGRTTLDILGEEGAKRLVEFERIAGARDMAADVASSLYFTDTPLAPAQVDRLVQILAAARNPTRNGTSGYDWDAVIAKAGTVLLPEQVAVLAGKRATDLFQIALNRPRSAPPAAKETVSPTAK